MLLLKHLKKTFLQLILWLAFMLLIMTPFVWLNFAHPNHLQSVSRIISQNKLFFTAMRWLIIIVLFCAWPHFIRWWAKNHYWKPEKTMFWLKQRIKITLWLIIFELVVCENLFLILLHLLEGH